MVAFDEWTTVGNHGRRGAHGFVWKALSLALWIASRGVHGLRFVRWVRTDGVASRSPVGVDVHVLSFDAPTRSIARAPPLSPSFRAASRHVPLSPVLSEPPEPHATPLVRARDGGIAEARAHELPFAPGAVDLEAFESA